MLKKKKKEKITRKCRESIKLPITVIPMQSKEFLLGEIILVKELLFGNSQVTFKQNFLLLLMEVLSPHCGEQLLSLPVSESKLRFQWVRPQSRLAHHTKLELQQHNSICAC